MSEVAGAAARRVALRALCRIDEEGAYTHLVLPGLLQRSGLDERDRRLVTDLVAGTTRMRRACDAVVAPHLRRRCEPAVQAALRLGAYQLVFLGVPAHAAVSATVEAAPGRARSLVNAVLRRVAQHGPPPSWASEGERLSYPDWIVDRLTADLGAADALAALAAMNDPPALLPRPDGYIQDRSSQAVVDLVGAGPGERVADLCAAPGGKATGLAAAGAWVVAADRRPARVRAMQGTVTRLEAGDRIGVVVADAGSPPLQPGRFDRVLVDAPCSGLGALRHRPDARWRITPEAVARLAALQPALAVAASTLLRPGGVLIYSVCTLTAAETRAVDDALARQLPGWEADPPPDPWRRWGRGGLVLPSDAGGDGMFALRLRRPGTR